MNEKRADEGALNTIGELKDSQLLKPPTILR